MLPESSDLNFIGCIEGKDLFAGKADVVVADGFVGNVAMKMAEATAEFVFRVMRQELRRSLAGKVGGWILRASSPGLRLRFDWREYGGAPLLGIDGVAVIAHGRSDARAIESAIRAARDAVKERLPQRLREAFAPAGQ